MVKQGGKGGQQQEEGILQKFNVMSERGKQEIT